MERFDPKIVGGDLKFVGRNCIWVLVVRFFFSSSFCVVRSYERRSEVRRTMV